MRVIALKDVNPQQASDAIFQGQVAHQPLVNESFAKGLVMQVVNFSPGARTKLHTHTMDQVLYVIAGRGILATEHEQHTVAPGTLVYVPPGERHWHGATSYSTFSHISITPPGKTDLC